LLPAPKGREAAHPQERQHSAAKGGTRDRVRPAATLNAAIAPSGVEEFFWFPYEFFLYNFSGRTVRDSRTS
jgi:hypothetical protein